MAAPKFVPTKPTAEVRTYASPPRRNDSWTADRPGDLGGAGQPTGDRFGSPGPDQGYALSLMRGMVGTLQVQPDESLDDVCAGVVAVALKRASLFGRAPVVHDLTVACTVWGFLDVALPAELLAARKARFAGVAHPHHYVELRGVADAVPADVLRLTPAEVAARHDADWQSLLQH